jgi:hypothetical protein
MLRHGCGFALANAGHDTRSLQAYLGHRNIQHTVRYTELAPDRFKNFWLLMSAGKIEWSHDVEFWSATAAEHVFVGPYELVTFGTPPSDQFPARDIGWELFGGEKFMSQLAKGKAASFDEAKATAEAELAAQMRAEALRRGSAVDDPPAPDDQRRRRHRPPRARDAAFGQRARWSPARRAGARIAERLTAGIARANARDDGEIGSDRHPARKRRARKAASRRPKSACSIRRE